jgi:hypothetical protein
LFDDLSPTERTALWQFICDDAVSVDWSEEDVVHLHWRLLQALRDLCDPRAPLEEKFEALRWVFTEPERDAAPFSFTSCVRVVGCSPLSPTPFFGALDTDAIRDWIRRQWPTWLTAGMQRYPSWVRDAVAAHPAWIAQRLASNPQWLNEQMRRRIAQPDLFA